STLPGAGRQGIMQGVDMTQEKFSRAACRSRPASFDALGEGGTPMRFMVLVYPGETKVERMGKYNEDLVKAGVMLGGDGLYPPQQGARIAFAHGGKKTVTDGPFAEASETIGGYWLWQVKSREEALEWARRAPMADGAVLELRQCLEPQDSLLETI